MLNICFSMHSYYICIHMDTAKLKKNVQEMDDG